MNDYYEKLREEIYRDWNKAIQYRVHAWWLTISGIFLLVYNVSGYYEHPNHMLGVVSLIVILAGGIWLWDIYAKEREIKERLGRMGAAKQRKSTANPL